MDVLVVCYHAVSHDWPSELAVIPEQLERQVSHLLGRGYEPATFTDAVLRPRARRTMAITFDDGCRSVAELGLPVLARLGVPATLFVATSFVGSDTPMAWPGVDHWIGTEHEQELLPVHQSHLDDLAAAGWELGSHTRTHPRLTQLGDAELEQELAASRAEMERMCGGCTSIAYPYGDCDRRVADAAAHAGYTAAATLPDRFPSHAEPLLWPRVGIYRGHDLAAFRRRVSPVTRRLESSPLWSAVEAVLPRVRAGSRALRQRARGDGSRR